MVAASDFERLGALATSKVPPQTALVDCDCAKGRRQVPVAQVENSPVLGGIRFKRPLSSPSQQIAIHLSEEGYVAHIINVQLMAPSWDPLAHPADPGLEHTSKKRTSSCISFSIRRANHHLNPAFQVFASTCLDMPAACLGAHLEQCCSKRLTGYLMHLLRFA